MPFIGKNPTSGFSTIVKDDLTADGSTTAFTLSKQVASANDVAVFVGNVRQEPTDAYSVNGTTLTMTAAPASGINFYVLHIAGTLESSVIPADDTISTAKIQSSAVTDAKIAGMASSKLTGALPAIDGSSLTGIDTLVTCQQLDHALTTSSGWQESGQVTIPESGVYLIETVNRIRWGANTYYIKSALSTSSTNGSGIFTEHRMLIERVTTNSFGNIGNTVSWIIDVPSGATTPLNIYLHVYYQTGDTYNGQYNDANGRPHIRATKLYETSQTDSTVDEITTKTS